MTHRRALGVGDPVMVQSSVYGPGGQEGCDVWHGVIESIDAQRSLAVLMGHGGEEREVGLQDLIADG